MDKKELFDTVINLEEQIGSLYRQLGDLKQHIGEMIEENHHYSLKTSICANGWTIRRSRLKSSKLIKKNQKHRRQSKLI